MPPAAKSRLKHLLRRTPMPLLAALLGLLVGSAVWVVVDRIQTRAIADIFARDLGERLEQRARAALIRFDQFIQSYVAVTRLLANHRRMADYLDPIIWFPEDAELPVEYREVAPRWLPDPAIWRVTRPPSHVLLVDPKGGVREQYLLSEAPLPFGVEDMGKELLASVGKATLLEIDDQPYLMAADLVEDNGYNIMGALVLLVPLDADFLNASQQRAGDESAPVALVDAQTEKILVSSEPAWLADGSDLEQSKLEFVVTAQSFYEYGQTPLNLLFATFVPRAKVEETGQIVLDVERRHRFTGMAIVTAVFILLFVLVSSRINRLLRRISAFSTKALEMEQTDVYRGNQLMAMEDWIPTFVQAVMRTREEMRVRHAAEIREKDALKTAVLNTSLDPIVTIDRHGLILDFNPTAEQTFGYAAADVVGQPLGRLTLAKGSQDAFEAQLREAVLQPSEPNLRILSGRRKDGSEFPVELAIKPVMLADTLVFTCYLRDISERRRQAQEIQSLAAFPAESPMPVMRINRPGVVIYANKASEPLLKHWECGRMQTVPIYWRQQVEAVLQSGRPLEIEVTTEAGLYSLLLSPVRDQQYVNLYGRDISAIRAAEEQAKQRQEELIHVSRFSTMGEMASGIAHELNQPLSAILNFANGCARRIRLRIDDQQGLLDALAQISAQATRAGEIIKRLRGMVARKQPVRRIADLNLLIEEVLALLDHERRRMHIALERITPPGKLAVWVDPVQIEQVLLNLVRNAFDALESREPLRRRLVIETGRTDSGGVFCAIKDNGKGIDAEEMKHLFDPFFTTKPEGMGVGLSISHTIVTDHNGKINVESVPRRGTIFRVELPAAEQNVESIAS